ncbi:UPF0182 family protein [Erythrobacter sp. YJ-T3-07]|uniref:UPF0182 family protein n=1 Tax=Erythrobacter sp. YJ-T3-07 TaxID=2793063 RepID=UPI0018D38B0A|nr:UPF0182 family protein [Erythrobacter sp. YJ-T3-07]MBH1943811.1 UPF0182 family protein [Erythrobacter sp. YJ-T3-07]
MLRPSASVRAATFFLFGGVTSTLFYWVVGLAVFLLAVILSARFYTEVLWFDELGYLDVYLTVVKTKIWMGVVPFLFMTGLVAGNMALAYKLARADRVISADERRVDAWRRAFEPYFRPLVLTVSLICGLVVGLQTYPHWQTYILWANGTEWGRNDPQFGRDLSYFMFELSLHVMINHWLFVCVLVALLLTLITSYIFGGIRPQAPHSMLPFQVNLHISVLVFALMALIGWGMLLELHLLSYSERGVVTGLGFTDSNASLLAYKFVAAAVVSGFVMFQVNIRRPGYIIPTIVIVYLILVGLSIVRFYPNLFQLIIVEPQELEREESYIEDHLQFTRYGFGLDRVDRRTASVADTGKLAAISNDRRLLETLRLWDPATLLINFRELQAFRAYYDFKDIDVDRYVIGGELQPVMIAARELDTEQLPERSRRWEAEHLIYTHGYGLVSADVAGASEAGMPQFLTSDVPTGGSGPTFVRNPQIYFGESSPEFSIVKSSTIELGRPREGLSFAKHEYAADTGVKIDGLLSRLLFAINFWDIRLALTTLLTDDSRVLYHRNVRERVQRVVPFLEVDADPYPVAANGRIKWVLDCYTTSDMMPYSKRINLSDFSQVFQGKQESSGIIPAEFIRLLERRTNRANYVRGSVKAVVDAYDGSVDLYVTDPSDHVLQAWRNAFPGVFKPVEQASAALRAHFRYPQDLFQIQSVIWADYHMRASDAYYTREGAWRIPKDADYISLRRERARPDHEQRNVDLRPYWLRTRFPQRPEPEFAIVQPFTPENRNVLSGYLVGGSDRDRLGKLISYSFPPDATVIGPAQAQARIDQDERVSAWMTLRMQSGSRVSRGRLLTIPLDNAILYVQPLFVQADKSSVSELLGAQLASVPELKQVVIVFGDRVLMRPTLKQAVAALFGDEPGATRNGDKPLPSDAPKPTDEAASGEPER